ncbi:MAG: hypothetical protein HC892_20150 [Saprospiraceae bacterium]|nr:hypothetical protein [Saprospiraceae bacterium]
MIEEIFNDRKRTILGLINRALASSGLSDLERDSLKGAMSIISEYSFINRHQMKGKVANAVIDKLRVPRDLGEKIISFDKNIS